MAILAVFTPSLVALVLTVRSKGRRGLYNLFVTQTVRRTAFKWLLVSIAGIPLLASLAVLSASGFDVSGFSLRTSSRMPQMPLILLIALGEEYGWRGFLLPRLMKRYNLLQASMRLGLIWGLWHFPAYLIGIGVPLQMDFLVFLLWVVLGALFISWIY